jgi:hypothetical protein
MGEFNQQFQPATAKFPTQGNREFFPPEQGIFRPNRELTGNLRKHRRQVRNGAKSYRCRSSRFDRNPLQSPEPHEKCRWCGNLDGRNHGFVNRIIMRPHFGPAHAKLACETNTVASGPGPDRIPDSSAPQPPGVRSDRARVLFSVRFNPPILRPALSRPSFLRRRFFWMTEVG